MQLIAKSDLNTTVPEEWKVENVTVERTSGLTQISIWCLCQATYWKL